MLDIRECIETIAEVMQRFSAGETVMPVRLGTTVPERGVHLAMPAVLPFGGRLRHQEYLRLSDQSLPRRALPYSDWCCSTTTDTGRPLAVMDAGLPDRRAHCRRFRRRHRACWPTRTPFAWR